LNQAIALIVAASNDLLALGDDLQSQRSQVIDNDSSCAALGIT
jgi:hypothetical protein